MRTEDSGNNCDGVLMMVALVASSERRLSYHFDEDLKACRAGKCFYHPMVIILPLYGIRLVYIYIYH